MDIMGTKQQTLTQLSLTFKSLLFRALFVPDKDGLNSVASLVIQCTVVRICIANLS